MTPDRPDFLRAFPGTPRPVQTSLLSELAESWDKFDVFLISAPTGLGKSFIARAITNVFPSSAYLVPTKQLLQQYLNLFSGTQTLQSIESYQCHTWGSPCAYLTKRGRSCSHPKCTECLRWGKDFSAATYKTQTALALLYHIQIVRNINREVLICDEAHLIFDIIKTLSAKHVWRHSYPYVGKDLASLRTWLEGVEEPTKKKDKQAHKLLKEAVFSPVPTYVAHVGTDRFRGDTRDCVRLFPVDLRDNNKFPWLCSEGTKKVIMLSATLSPRDAEAAGLGRTAHLGRIAYMECSSPIPPSARSIALHPEALPINYTFLQDEENFSRLAKLVSAICAEKEGLRGIIHCTYSLARRFEQRAEFADRSRFLFHTKSTKQVVYGQFISNVSKPLVLFACGMYEGIDLPHDLGRFQIIAKIPWPSLAEPAIKHLAEHDRDGYVWTTVKTVIQACGRICRGPDDWGDTIIIDNTWKKLYNMAKGLRLIPRWFEEAVL